MNTETPPNGQGDRRDFLRHSITLFGAVFFFSATAESRAGAEPEAADGSEQPANPSKGYQETLHVRTYYEKVRF